MRNRLNPFFPPPVLYRRNPNQFYHKPFTDYKNSTKFQANTYSEQVKNKFKDTQDTINFFQQNMHSDFFKFIPTFFNTNEIIFEIFGLKIYFDDILIICIMLFLYLEGIHDEYLYICLALLLLS